MPGLRSRAKASSLARAISPRSFSSRKRSASFTPANARFVKVVFNGEVIHENAPVECPTGTAWRTKKEVARGPLMLQGDHGPVAFRNVRIRPSP